MLNKSHSGFVGTIVSIVSTIAILGAAGWVVLNRQFVLDNINFLFYTPSSQIATIENSAGMSNTGKFYFYASQPQVEDAQQFNQNCARQETGSAILGCYSNQRIYVYDVTNTQLNGVEEVTAAHETLHAVWDRMSSSDKKRIGDLLEVAFSKINDPALNARMAYYARTEPGQRTNELHSILGTEYANLGPALEAHYAKYFTNRNKVVALHASYQSVFDNLTAQKNALSAQMATLKASIDSQSAQYNAEAVSLNSDASALQNSASSVDRTSQSEVDAYNAKRQALLNRLDGLNALRTQINTETNAYNVKVTEYNKIVVSTNSLNASLDSSLSPTPSL